MGLFREIVKIVKSPSRQFIAMVEKPQGRRRRTKQEDGKGGGEPVLRDCQQDDASSGRKVRKSGGNDKQEGDCIVFHGGVIFYFLEVSVKLFLVQ
jgi:hypothetical protein